ncbi:MAG TPA: TaqI-like C-terminal specificity domain-containing protein, partial [bacterium]|nr:TaqI-like C-terminal specificity domain-containing protein [bacterium]
SRFHELPGNVWNILITEKNAEFLKRLTTSFAQLGNIAKINRGLITGDRDSYFATKQATSKHVPILAGGDIYRYHFSQPSEFVLFERPKTAGGCWDREVHLAPHKIAVRQIGEGPTATWINKPIAVTGNIFTVRGTDKEHELFLLGILNSKLVDYFWRVMFADFKGSFPQVTIFSLEQVPVREIDQKKKSDREAHGKMVKLVEQTLSLHEQAATARTPQEKTANDRQISATDAQIDRLVYDLYGLTEEEIKIVEGSML